MKLLLFASACYLTIGLMIWSFVELRPYHKPIRIRINAGTRDILAMMIGWPFWLLDRHITRKAAKIYPWLRDQ